jgi:hypothetical protein
MITLTNELSNSTTNQVVLNDATNVTFDASQTLATLENKRISWEAGAYRTSNQELYGILAECLAYVTAELTLVQAKQRSAALEAFFKSRSYNYKSEMPLATRVVRAVFGGIDRRRTSTYSLVIRQAIKEKVLPMNLASWIEEKKGIQEIKLGRSATFISPKNKVDMGKEIFEGKVVIGNAKSELLSHLADAQFMSNACVLLAEQMPNGSFDIKALVRNDSAINAAYHALYQQQKEAIERAKAEVDAANDADGAVNKAA